MDKNTKREIILEHFQNPVNKELPTSDNYLKYNTNNPNCIDNIDLYVDIKDGIIKDLKFMGEACAVSTASASIMIKNLLGKTVEDAKKYIDSFAKMTNEEEYDEEVLQEGIVFDEIYKETNRRNCVLLPYKSIMKAIEDYEKE